MISKHILLLRDALSPSLLLIVASALFVLPVRNARGLVPLGDGGLFFHVGAVGTYDTNVFANADEEGDFFLTLIPEGQYQREAGVLHLDARLGLQLIHFLDLSSQDTEDPFASLSLSYPNQSEKSSRKVVFDLGWRQESSTREEVGDRTRSEIIDFALTGRRDVSDRLALRGGGDYTNEQFSRGTFSEIDTWALNLDGVHVYSDNLETFIGYRYRHTETAGNSGESLSPDDHLVQIGAEGQLSARVVGLVSAGVQKRFFGDSEIRDDLQPYGMASVTWTPRTRTEIVFLGVKDFSVTPDDRSVDRTNFRLILNQGVYRGFSVAPVVSYTHREVERSSGLTREDDRYEAGLAFIYDLAGGASTALRYSFLNQSSDDPFFDYQRHIVDISAKIIF